MKYNLNPVWDNKLIPCEILNHCAVDTLSNTICSEPYFWNSYLNSIIYHFHQFNMIIQNHGRSHLKKKKHKVQPERKDKELHAVLTYKNVLDKMTSKSLSGCINRDKNSVLNMIKIVSHLITNGERPYLFKRGQVSESPKRKSKVKDSVDARERST